MWLAKCFAQEHNMKTTFLVTKKKKIEIVIHNLNLK